ncbi:hypothetical protein JR316_0002776 [Psilocybe cubensis]|uniref:Fucose-specific lectin n=2 Tax=Psilocybe cubensis TaxID=181762 RepID=A0A8H7Y5Z2_PSICU|nr:hypothetical protein JR316_0002776 [Psilocybe cubensis]KAH9485861.1 hypothetical protein JR316_0002776 [Psilocybe cubensis]
MAGVYLPDTALATVSLNKDVFTYAQTTQGAIIECQGALEVPIGTQNVDIYMYDHQNHVVSRYQGSVERPNAPKLYTPLAASVISSTKYVFYVDDTNTLRGVKSPNWAQEAGLATLAIRVAAYSQLTATTIAENGFQAICLYYQSPRRDAGIEMVSFTTKTNQWVKGIPDMTPIPPPPPPPPPRVVDPPLYGTSLCAVKVRPGISVIPNSKMPVVYLQWDTLALAHSQEAMVETIRTLDLKFAPHTSLAIVDDGALLYCFYTSSQNNHIKMITIKDYKASAPVVLGTPTPRSTIAAVLPTQDRIVLFYQALNFSVGAVELKGLTLVRDQGTKQFAPLPNSEPASLA